MESANEEKELMVIGMNYFSDENNIIDWLHGNCSRISTITGIDDSADIIIERIFDPDKWNLWVNSAGKNAPPPDYYCSEARIMMEVMRIDDHAFIGRKGGVINETNARESLIQRELHQQFPCVQKIIVNAVTELQGKDDHNYSRYLESIKRVVAQHVKHIELYRKNHPEYKLIFFVFDESSAYCETENKNMIRNGIREGQSIEGRKHHFYEDKAMLDTFRGADIDYLVWFAPFKRYFGIDESEQVPNAWFYDLKKMPWDKLVGYTAENMISVEE